MLRYNDKELVAAIDRVSKYVADMSPFMRDVGRELRNAVRRNIMTSGATFGAPYAPLSWWTTAKTGRSKALWPLRNQFEFRATKTGVVVFYNQLPGKSFDLNWHHKGATIPERFGRPLMVINLGAIDKVIFLKRARQTKIPARRIWPTHGQAKKLLDPAIRRFERDIVRKWQP